MKTLLKLLTGLALVALLGAVAIGIEGAPGSAASAEKRLAARAEAALDGAGWARVEIDGQKAVLTGEAPSEAARARLVAQVTKAAGPGGPALGGVTKVDASGVAIAAPPVAETRTTPPASIEALILAEAAEGTAEPGDQPRAPEPAPSEDLSPEIDDCATRLRAAIDRRRIGFASARAELDAASRLQLRDIASIHADCADLRLAISGHTDASGDAARNLMLSAARAEAVRTFLESVGAPGEQISARGAGSAEPLADNASAAGRALNRRIEIAILDAEISDAQ